jgi:hypothetical protein
MKKDLLILTLLLVILGLILYINHLNAAHHQTWLKLASLLAQIRACRPWQWDI